jgi:hypothetical protein
VTLAKTKVVHPDGRVEFVERPPTGVETISTRHTTWGVECQATDVDLFIEHALGEPLAMVEYKSEGAPARLGQPANIARETVARRARIGYAVVEYRRDFSGFRVDYANAWWSAAWSGLRCRPWSRTEWIAEDEYAGFLSAWQRYRRELR